MGHSEDGFLTLNTAMDDINQLEVEEMARGGNAIRMISDHDHQLHLSKFFLISSRFYFRTLSESSSIIPDPDRKCSGRCEAESFAELCFPGSNFQPGNRTFWKDPINRHPFD